MQANEENILETLKTQLLEVLGVVCLLSPRERDVFKLRLGIDDGRHRSLEDVAQLFGVKRERIRTIYDRAIRKIMRLYETSERKHDLAYIYIVGFNRNSYIFRDTSKEANQ